MPGCQEVVHDYENGLLVLARDSEALANAILVLLRDPQLRLQMGRRSRERAELEFSIDSVVQQHLAIYDKLLSNCAGR